MSSCHTAEGAGELDKGFYQTGVTEYYSGDNYIKSDSAYYAEVFDYLFFGLWFYFHSLFFQLYNVSGFAAASLLINAFYNIFCNKEQNAANSIAKQV